MIKKKTIAKLVRLLFIFLCLGIVFYPRNSSNQIHAQTNSLNYNLAFSTYLGGSAGDIGRDVATDAAGNIYVTGGTASPNFPVTVGPTWSQIGSSNPTCVTPGTAGRMNVFVTKFSPNGQLLWSRLIGSNCYSRAYAVKADGTGVYVAGRAGDNYPVTSGAMQKTFGGSTFNGTNSNYGAYGAQDGFVTKLSLDGATIIWSSYIGGSDNAFIRDMDIDATGDVYLAVGDVACPLPEAISGSLNPTSNCTFSGNTDLAVVKVAADGSKALWGTYVGGSGNDGVGPSIKINYSDGSIYVMSTTSSSDLPTKNAFQPTYGGGLDVFLSRWDSSGNLIFRTYFGGSGEESTETHHLALDPSGNAFIDFYVNSTNMPITANAFQKALGGAYDIGVAKFSPTGGLLAATYLGGSAGESPQGLATDSSGNLYVFGASQSTNYPITANAYQTVNRYTITSGLLVGTGIITVLTPDLSKEIFSTYFGGSGADQFRSGVVDPTGAIIGAGWTASTNMPTLNAFQNSNGGSPDVMIAKFSPASAQPFATPTLPPPTPTPTPCTLTSAFWSPSGPVTTGTTVNLNVIANGNCTGLTVNYQVIRDDGLLCVLPGCSPPANVQPAPQPVPIVGNAATITWSAEHNPLLPGTDPDYLFNANLTGQTTTIRSATDLHVNNPSPLPSPTATPTPLPSSNNYTIAFSTYLGGTDFEQARDVTTDAQGNIYVTGGTLSGTSFPATTRIKNTTGSCVVNPAPSFGDVDVFVTKYSPKGQIIWSTIVGGPCYDRAYAVEVDSQGYVYVAGRAGGAFPTTVGSVQPTFAGTTGNSSSYGAENGFAFKLTPDGKNILWATYFGTSAGEAVIRDMDIDSSGNVYLGMTGTSVPFDPNTQSNIVNAINTTGFKTQVTGTTDAAVAKISSDGSKVLYASYIGGNQDTGGAPTVRVDNSGLLYFAGGTNSTSGLPITSNAFQQTYGGGAADILLLKIDPTKTGMASVLYGTYYGGSGGEGSETHYMTIDKGSPGTVYLSGDTNSPDLPITGVPGFSKKLAGNSDAFIAKFDTNLVGKSSLLAGTFYGGNNYEGTQGIYADSTGIYIGGPTGSTNLPVTSNAYQKTFTGTGDAFIAKFDPTLSSLLYATYIGGSGVTNGRSLWIDGASGSIISVGATNSTTGFPIVNAAQPTYGGGILDSYVTKFSLASVSPNPLPTSTLTPANTPIPSLTVSPIPTATPIPILTPSPIPNGEVVGTVKGALGYEWGYSVPVCSGIEQRSSIQVSYDTGKIASWSCLATSGFNSDMEFSTDPLTPGSLVSLKFNPPTGYICTGWTATYPNGEYITQTGTGSIDGTCQALIPIAANIGSNPFSSTQGTHLQFNINLAPTPTPVPTSAPIPTPTPTTILLATATPRPLSTPLPTATSVPLSTPTPTPVPIPGDANGDGKVDGVDYTIWLINNGRTGVTCGSSCGDFNGDSKVGEKDLQILLNNFNF